MAEAIVKTAVELPDDAISNDEVNGYTSPCKSGTTFAIADSFVAPARWTITINNTTGAVIYKAPANAVYGRTIPVPLVATNPDGSVDNATSVITAINPRSIGDNGNWIVDGVDTNIPARGQDGAPGEKGDPGNDGAAGTSLTITDINTNPDTGEITITFSDGSTITVPAGKDGNSGEAGAPGEAGSPYPHNGQ